MMPRGDIDEALRQLRESMREGEALSRAPNWLRAEIKRVRARLERLEEMERRRLEAEEAPE